MLLYLRLHMAFNHSIWLYAENTFFEVQHKLKYRYLGSKNIERTPKNSNDSQN